MSVNHSWIDLRASLLYGTLGGRLGWGGAWERQLGQPMGPLAQEPDRMDDGWLTNLFIWHISYPKATPSASRIT